MSSRKVLVFRHVPFEGAGHIAPALERHGFTLEYVDLYRSGAALPDTKAAAGLIFLGGPMSVNDDLPYLRQEMQLIVEAVERGQPVLGICLGSQAIAKALGSRVYRNTRKEIGWFDLHLTEAGAEDPLFRGVPARQTVFHWHGEVFDAPAGSVRLAWSDRTPNQAFRVGTNVYGMQFHLEVTPEMIADWCLQEENCGDLLELDSPFEPQQDAEVLQRLAYVVFGRWCELL